MPFKLRRRDFATHLDAIAATGRAPVSAEAIDFARPGRHLLLTFDDGGTSALHAGEALAARGWKAHFFITTGKLGTRTFLDAAGVRALHAAGHVVGTHSTLAPQRLSRAAGGGDARRVGGEPRAARGDPRRRGDGSFRCREAIRRPPSSARPRSRACATCSPSEPDLAPRRAGRASIIGRACVKATTSAAEVRALASFHGWRRQWMIWRLKDAARNALDPAYRRWVQARRARDALARSATRSGADTTSEAVAVAATRRAPPSFGLTSRCARRASLYAVGIGPTARRLFARGPDGMSTNDSILAIVDRRLELGREAARRGADTDGVKGARREATGARPLEGARRVAATRPNSDVGSGPSACRRPWRSSARRPSRPSPRGAA